MVDKGRAGKSMIICAIMIMTSLSTIVMGYADPNDTYWLSGDQWNAERIEADKAWDLNNDNKLTHTGSDSIIIAVLDSGIHWDPVDSQFRHEDISEDLIWRNWNEDLGDANDDGAPGIEYVDDDGDDQTDEGDDDDDDENGYADDIWGWNCIIDSGDRADLRDDGWWICGYDGAEVKKYNHGTQMAGIIAATINNGKGIAGIAPNVKIMNLKIFDEDKQYVYPPGEDPYDSYPELEGTYYDLDDTIEKAFRYAIDNGADIISMSWQQHPDKDYLDDLLEEAYEKNILMVAPSGALGGCSELVYPANSEYVIGVGASTSAAVPNEKRVSSSQYKDQTFSEYDPYQHVEIVAPSFDGTESLMVPYELSGEDKYKSIDSGTASHYAVPQVAATAGMMLSYQPSLTNRQVRKLLHTTADDILTPEDSTQYPGGDRYTGFGRLNVAEALKACVLKKPEFLQAYDYTNPPFLIEAPHTNDPDTAYAHDLAIDCNGYLHVAFIEEYNNVQEICYMQLNPNMDVRVSTVRIEVGHQTQGWDSLDPEITIDKDEDVHIAWREPENIIGPIWHVSLDLSGNEIANSFNVVDTINNPRGWFVANHLNLEASRRRTALYMTWAEPDAHWEDGLRTVKTDYQGKEVSNVLRRYQGQYAWIPEHGYYSPSMDIYHYESTIEEIVVLCEHTDYNTHPSPNDDVTGIGLWWVKDLGAPNHLFDVGMATYWPPMNYPFGPSNYLDPDVDVDYDSGQLCGVFRCKQRSAPTISYYANLKYISTPKSSYSLSPTYHDDVMDITDTLQPQGWGGIPRYCFNPQISINQYDEVRVVYEEADYLASVALRRDGRLFHGKADSSHRNYYLTKPYTAGDFNSGVFRFAHPQVISTDLSYASRSAPFDNDANFHSAYLQLSDPNGPGTDQHLIFETTRQFGNSPGRLDASLVGEFNPDIACDEYDGRHVVWYGLDTIDGFDVYYSYYAAGLDIGTDSPTIGPIDLDAGSSDGVIEPQVAVSTDDDGLVVVHIVWDEYDMGPPIVDYLKYTQILIDPVTPGNSEYDPPVIDGETVDGSPTDRIYGHVRIVPYNDYDPKTLTDPMDYYEYVFMTWYNDHGEVLWHAIDWENDWIADDEVTDNGMDPEIDVDSLSNIYIVYKSGIHGYLSKWEFAPVNSWERPDDDGVFEGGDIEIDEPGSSPQFQVHDPKIILDRITDRRDGGDHKNVVNPFIHIIYSGIHDQSLVDKHHLYYVKYHVNGEPVINAPRVIFPPLSGIYDYYSDVSIDARMALTRDNEIAVVFGATIETDEVDNDFGYNWHPIDQSDHLWLLYLTNNGMVHSNPVFINQDYNDDCMNADVAMTSDNTFNVVYFQSNHVKGISSDQGQKFYIITQP